MRRTAWRAAPVPLLPWPRWTMADTLRILAVQTVQAMDHHEATRSGWKARLGQHAESIAHQHQ